MTKITIEQFDNYRYWVTIQIMPLSFSMVLESRSAFSKSWSTPPAGVYSFKRIDDMIEVMRYSKLEAVVKAREWTPVGKFGINIGAETFTPKCYDTGSRDLILDAHNAAVALADKHSYQREVRDCSQHPIIEFHGDQHLSKEG
jgi:hypothetical protein